MLHGLATGRQPFVGQEDQHQHQRHQPKQVDKESVVPPYPRQEPRHEGGHHATQLVGGGGKPHQARLLLRREIIGEQPRRERHHHTHAHAQQCPQHQQPADVVDKESTRPGRHIQRQAHGGKRARAHPAAEEGEQQIGDDDKECRQRNDKLHGQLALVGEMAAHHAQRGCHGRPGHNRKQRDRKDSACESLRRPTCRAFCHINNISKTIKIMEFSSSTKPA